jgi:hypothetical protein
VKYVQTFVLSLDIEKHCSDPVSSCRTLAFALLLPLLLLLLLLLLPLHNLMMVWAVVAHNRLATIETKVLVFNH